MSDLINDNGFEGRVIWVYVTIFVILQDQPKQTRQAISFHSFSHRNETMAVVLILLEASD